MALPSKNDLARSYTSTMNDMRSELSPNTRRASQLIHWPVIAGLLSVLALLLRPRAITLAGVFAVIAIVATYLLVVLYGYTPGGAEALLAFSIGWLIGLVIDLFATATRTE